MGEEKRTMQTWYEQSVICVNTDDGNDNTIPDHAAKQMAEYFYKRMLEVTQTDQKSN